MIQIMKFLYKCNVFKTLVYNLIIKGNKGLVKNSIILYGNLRISVHKKSKINIYKGYLHLNQGTSTYEPFIGMLEMHENSEISVMNSFIIKSGCHIIVARNGKLILGNGYINRNVKIKCFSRIEIGNGVAISENVTIWDSDAHRLKYDGYEMTKPIKIEDNVWIGTNVTILKGVTIGEGAVIAAGSLVNKSVPARSLVGGVPARVIKENVSWE